jgi:hypothetical protein
MIVAVGACACTGGIHAYRNFIDANKFAQMLNSVTESSYVSPAPIDKHINVDHSIPGCPPNRGEIVKFLKKHLIGKNQITCRNPVCFECRLHENRCLLEDGKLCLGPVTAGGCGAGCPNGKFECWGCRGPTDNPNHEAIIDLLEQKGLRKEDTKQRLRTFAGMKIETPQEQNIKEVLTKIKKDAYQAVAKEQKKRAKEEKETKRRAALEKKKKLVEKKKLLLEKKKETAALKLKKKKERQIIAKELAKKKAEQRLKKSKEKKLAMQKKRVLDAKRKEEKKRKAQKIKEEKLKKLAKLKILKIKAEKAKKIAAKKAVAQKLAKKSAAKKQVKKKKAPAKPAKKSAKKSLAKKPVQKTAAKTAPVKKMTILGRIAALGKRKKK